MNSDALIAIRQLAESNMLRKEVQDAFGKYHQRRLAQIFKNDDAFRYFVCGDIQSILTNDLSIEAIRAELDLRVVLPPARMPFPPWHRVNKSGTSCERPVGVTDQHFYEFRDFRVQIIDTLAEAVVAYRELQMKQPSANPAMRTAGVLRLDSKGQTLWIHNEAVALTTQQTKLLETLFVAHRNGELPLEISEWKIRSKISQTAETKNRVNPDFPI